MRFLHEPIARAITTPPSITHQDVYSGAVDFVYLDAPIPASQIDRGQESRNGKEASPDRLIDSWVWGDGDPENGEIIGVETVLARLTRVLDEQGPFMGIIGFSEGAAWAMVLCGLLERQAKALTGLHVSIPYHLLADSYTDSTTARQITHRCSLALPSQACGLNMSPTDGCTRPRLRPLSYILWARWTHW